MGGVGQIFVVIEIKVGQLIVEENIMSDEYDEGEA
jgi:hypothetical protein